MVAFFLFVLLCFAVSRKLGLVAFFLPMAALGLLYIWAVTTPTEHYIMAIGARLVAVVVCVATVLNFKVRAT